MRSATRLLVSVFGVVAAVAGVEHGIGEMLQGSTAPEGVTILSWPESAFFAVLGGEPAMTLIPNLLVSGIVSVLLTLIFLVWVVAFAGRKHGGLVLIGLSLLMLLAGAGFGPPLLGLILGLVATRINAPLTWWRERAPAGVRRALAAVWPWAFGAALAAWLALFPGWPLVSYFSGVTNPDITMVIVVAAFGLLGLSIVSGLARDAQQQAAAPRRAFA